LAVRYLYSLYDALVSISVPSDKARAVVDAMEHEMGTKASIEAVHREMEYGFALLNFKIDSLATRLEQKIESQTSQLLLQLDAREYRITVKLGSMMVVGFGLVLAALRAWN